MPETPQQTNWTLPLIGILLSAPLSALFYLGEQAADLPFLPTNLMDWLIRNLPGGLITFGIDTMVDLIVWLGLGRVDETAKLMETLMAVGLFMGICTVAGVAYGMYVYQRLPGNWRWQLASGLGFGLAIATPMAIVSDYILTGNNPFYDGPTLLARSTWIVGMIAAWGIAFQVVLQRAFAQPKTTASDVEVGSISTTVGTEVTPEETPVRTSPASTAPEKASGTTIERINRRQFLIRLGGASATITVIGVGLGELFTEQERVVSLEQDFDFQNFPNANAGVMPAPGTRPEYTPLEDHYRIDINSRNPPEVDGQRWRLTVSGLVEREMEFTLDDLKNNYEPMYQYVTLSCISNRIAGDLISTTGWTGVSMQKILEAVRPTEDATHFLISSADGFFEIVSRELIEDDERIMLTYGWDGEELRVKHGFPLRIYIPDRYGMKQPKWITDIEAISEWRPGYWVEKGWDRDAIMRATSVIDTVAVDSVITRDQDRLIPIGGIAHAGARGISKVEIRVDGGEWVEGQVRQSLSDTTWAIWRYDWPFEDGEHTFEVRCYDGNGEMQILEENSRRPSGATGIHEVTQSV
ncbi:MAG: molybdopterin-dependent oxidoreductase [Chloroflexi bacterium]|nr:molybdopterin-dependent oxidoreductase [Chloroflexota bacterium]